MKNKKIAIGVFPRTAESVLVSYPADVVPYYIVHRGSEEEAWVKKFISQGQILPYEFIKKINGYPNGQSTLSIMNNSNLYSLLTKYDISHLLITIAKSSKREEWAKEHGITLVYTEFEKQMRYENKIWFDTFLKKNNISSPKSFLYTYDVHKFSIPFTGKVVLQKANSLGNSGTYILNTIEDIKKLIEKNSIQPNEEYLLREFISGKTYGIELFINSSTIAMSQARMQCFYDHEDIEGFRWFNGTQLVPTQEFSVSLQSKITTLFTQLGKLLHNDKYLGYAGIDCIIDDNENVFILECNPRFTSTSPLLIHYKETFSGLDTSNMFLEDFFASTPYSTSPHTFSYPTSVCNGSVLRLLLDPHSKKKRMKIKNIFPIGLYTCIDGKIEYKSPDIRNMGNTENEFIYYVDMKKNDWYYPNYFMGEIFANFPLFTKEGRVNEDGKTLLSHFTQ